MLNIVSYFGAGFHIRNLISLGQLLCFNLRNLSIFFHISFSADQYFLNIISRMQFYLFYPKLDFFERLSIRYIEAYENSLSSFVILFSQCLKSLLSSRIPNKNLNLFRINQKFFFQLGDPYCRDMIFLELFSNETQDKIGLTNPRISDS